MLFYVPPLLPVLAAMEKQGYDVEGSTEDGPMPQFSTQERARIPIRFMSRLFSAGNDEIVAEVYRKLFAVRVHMRSKKVGDVPEAKHEEALALGRTTPDEAEAIFRLTALPTADERYVLPPDDPRGRRAGARRSVHAQVGGRFRVHRRSRKEVLTVAACDTRTQVPDAAR